MNGGLINSITRSHLLVISTDPVLLLTFFTGLVTQFVNDFM